MDLDSDIFPIILGSGSPRRKQIFDALGIEYELSPADIDERKIEYKLPREFAIKAAYAKACAVEKRFRQGLVIAVDTIVVLDERIYGKPDDEEDARRMLSDLSGRTHRVISGVAVKQVGKSALLDAEKTDVHLMPLTEAEIAEYVATGEPLDKAGSYAIQGTGRRIVDHIDGDYFNVVGLPVQRLLGMMDFFTDTSSIRRNLPQLKAGFDPR